MNIIFWDPAQSDDEDSVLTARNENADFPLSFIQHRDFNKMARSNSGVGSGWGTFTLVAGVNDRIDFDEAGVVTANLTPATYNVDTLCAHLKAQMEAVGAHTYTWSYIENPDNPNVYHFRCVDETGNVAFPWLTGPNGSAGTGRTIGYTIGFDESADDGAAASHIADDIRVDNSWWLKIDLSAAFDVYGVWIRGHNFQNTGTYYAQLNAADAWGAPTVNQLLTHQADLMGYIWDAAQSYRWFRLLVNDLDNPDGYHAIGRLVIVGRFRPTRGFAPHGGDTPIDPSLIKRSADGQITTIQRSHFKTLDYTFEGTNQKTEFESLFTSVGQSKAFFYTEDPTNYLTTTQYVHFLGWKWRRMAGGFWNLSISMERER